MVGNPVMSIRATYGVGWPDNAMPSVSIRRRYSERNYPLVYRASLRRLEKALRGKPGNTFLWYNGWVRIIPLPIAKV